MQRELKVWGERWTIRQDSTHRTAYLELLPFRRCSWHRHIQKWNTFVVVYGAVEIRTQEGHIVLKRGECCTIKPGEWHEFRTYEARSAMLEEMYVEYSEDDIERVRLGGTWDPGKDMEL